MAIETKKETVIEGFWRLFRRVDAEGFTDRKLGLLAKAHKTTPEKIARSVAQYLLKEFPLCAEFTFPSPLLKRQLRLLSRLCDQVVQALFRGIDLHTLPAVRALFSRYTICEVTQRELIAEVKADAPQMHEHLFTFPRRYGVGEGHFRHLAKEIYQFLDQRLQLKVNIRLFYYKNLAAVVGGRALTWEKMTHLWVEEGGGDRDRVSRLTHDLVHRQPLIRKGDAKVPFQAFTIEKTIEEYERVVGVGRLDEGAREALRQACLNEEIRMDLVYFAQHVDAKLDVKWPAYRWTLAAQKYLTLCEKWTVPDVQRATLFRWCLKAPPDTPVPSPAVKKPIFPHYMDHVQNICRKFLAPKKREESALALLGAIEKRDPVQLGIDLESFITGHCWDYLGPLETAPLCAFIRAGSFLKDRKAKSHQLSSFLSDMGAQGHSIATVPGGLPLYLKLLEEEWSTVDTDEAKRLLRANPPVDQALQLLQNIAIKNRIKTFVGVPLPWPIEDAHIDSTHPKNGVLATLNELVELRARTASRPEIEGELSKLQLLGLSSETAAFVETGIAPFPTELLHSKACISYVGANAFDRVALGTWSYSNGGYYFHFCFARTSDGAFVQKKVAYHGIVNGLSKNDRFLHDLARRCMDPHSPRNPQSSWDPPRSVLSPP